MCLSHVFKIETIRNEPMIFGHKWLGTFILQIPCFLNVSVPIMDDEPKVKSKNLPNEDHTSSSHIVLNVRCIKFRLHVSQRTMAVAISVRMELINFAKRI